jgi:hypothetical protein
MRLPTPDYRGAAEVTGIEPKTQVRECKNLAKASNVVSDTKCSIPSASALAASTGAPSREVHPRRAYGGAVLRIGNFLILVTVGLVLVIGLAALFRHDPLLETIQFALILTVASIPVAFPAVLSVSWRRDFSQDARRLSRGSSRSRRWPA